MNDLISRRKAIDEIKALYEWHDTVTEDRTIDHLKRLPSAQPEIVHCRDCRYCKDVTSIHGECECPEMWRSLFGETTEVEAIEVYKDHYCGYAKRRTDD